MTEFSIHGKVRANDNKPARGYSVHAFDKDTINQDDVLGKKPIDANGFFRIDFDTPKFAPFYEILEGNPDVYLKLLEGQENKEILETKVTKTNKEI